MRKSLTALIELFKEAGIRWADDKCHRFGASLAFYALFSVFPLLMLAVTGLGFFLGDDEATRAKIVQSFASTGAPGAQSVIDQALANLQQHHTARGIGAVVGVVALVLSASAVFSELDTSLNKIWRCDERPTPTILKTIVEAVREKAVAMLLVLGTALFLLVSLIASTAIYAVTNSAREVLPFGWAWSLVEHVVSIGFLTITFAALFRVIPDCRGKWRDVLGGGFLTALLFTFAKRLVAFYLSTLTSYDAYGAVGAVLALLTWIYMVSLIVFYGAEFSRVYAENHGSLSAARRERAEPSAGGDEASGDEASGDEAQKKRDGVSKQRKKPQDGTAAHLLP